MENIGKTPRSTSSAKSEEGLNAPDSVKTPIEDVKKFEDSMKRREREEPPKGKDEEKKKEEGGIFDLSKKKPLIPSPAKRPPAELAKDEVTQAVINQAKKEVKDSKGKAEGEKKVGIEKLVAVKSEEKDESKSDESGEGENPFTPVQGQQAVGPFGQAVVTSASAPEQVGKTAGLQEMAELASTMLTKLHATHELSTASKEVRMDFGDANRNLKDVQAVISRDDKGGLRVEFLVKSLDAENYIAQNKNSLNASLRKELKDITDIRIDITPTGSDTQKDDRRGRSQGYQEYNPEEDQG